MESDNYKINAQILYECDNWLENCLMFNTVFDCSQWAVQMGIDSNTTDCIVTLTSLAMAHTLYEVCIIVTRYCV